MEYSDKPPMTYLASDPTDDRRSETARLLEECGEIAGTRLALAFSDALGSAADQLIVNGTQDMAPLDQKMWLEAADFAKSRQLGTVEYFRKHHRQTNPDAEKIATQEQQKWLEAADFTRIRHQAMVDSFSKHMERRYLLACQRKPGAIADHALQFVPSQLKLVEPDTQVDPLDSAMLIEAIRNAAWTALHDQTTWFRSALAAPEMLPIDTPLGPRLIGNAIADAIHDQCWGHESKKRLLSVLRREFPNLVKRVYLDLNSYLASAEAASQGPNSRQEHILPAAQAIPAEHPDTVANRQDNTSVASPENTGLAEVDSASLASATEAVAGRLVGIRLPRSVSDFLNGPWRDLLAKVQREQGASSQDWEDALRTMDDLIGSLRVKRTPESRVALMRTLPELARHLVRGLEYLGENIGKYDPFFARLAECHVRILGTSRPAKSPSPPVSAPARQSPQEAPPDESRLTTLEPGVWLEFLDPHFAHRKLKLAWISPNRNLFLLTNHLGERALHLGSKDLAALLQEGGARVIPTSAAPPASNAAIPASQDKKTA